MARRSHFSIPERILLQGAISLSLSCPTSGLSQSTSERMSPSAGATSMGRMAVRAAFGQFIAQSHREAEENSALRSPECRVYVLPVADSPLVEGVVEWLRSPRHTSLLLHVLGDPTAVRFRHRSSGETEVRTLHARHAAIWVGGALDALLPSPTQSQRGDEPTSDTTYVACRVNFVPGGGAES